MVDADDLKQVGAPLHGLLSKILVEKGETVKKNQPLFIIEAMKMETTVMSNEAGEISSLVLGEGSMVNTDDLIIKMS